MTAPLLLLALLLVLHTSLALLTGKNFVSSSHHRLQLASTFIPVPITQVQEAFAVNAAFSLLLLNSPQKSLTREGLLHSTLLGLGLYSNLGLPGWSLCVLYLIFGSVVTKIKMAEKKALNIAEKRDGARGPENVWGSAATAMMCALLSNALPAYNSLFRVGYVASLATKISDTFSSEIGKAYGKTTYLITTLKLVPKGTEGAVSVEGTAAGVAISVVFSLLAAALGVMGNDFKSLVVCVVAAFVATTAESFIGAIFQDSVPWLTNELVNLINTVIGAAAAMALYTML